MARTLFAYLPENAAKPQVFFDPSEDAHLDVADVSSADQLVFLAHGCAVTQLSVSVPARSEREARLAAPFAIEDEIGNEVDDVHIAFGPKPADLKDERTLYIVSKDQMDAWQAVLSEFPSNSKTLTAEQDLIPNGSALNLNDRVVGHGKAGPFAADIALGRPLLEVLTEGLSVLLPASDGLNEFAQWYAASEQPINLLQGDYRSRGSGSSSGVLKAWRVPLLLAAAVSIVWLSGLHMETQAYRAASQGIDADLKNAYQTAFPEERLPSNVVRAMRRKSTGGSQDGSGLDFLQTSAALYAAIDELEAARLRALRFEPRRGGLFASMTYDDYGYDAELKALLEEGGYVVQIGDARRTDEGVQGDVVVEGLR